MTSKSANDKFPPGFRLRHMLRWHTDIINRLVWSPDGRVLASCSEDRTIRLWDIATGDLLDTLRGHMGEITSVA